jgi:hypothetical protein
MRGSASKPFYSAAFEIAGRFMVKRIFSLAAVFGAGLLGYVVAAPTASAHDRRREDHIVQRCDRYGDECATFRCDWDWDDCVRISPWRRYYRPYYRPAPNFYSAPANRFGFWFSYRDRDRRFDDRREEWREHHRRFDDDDDD